MFPRSTSATVAPSSRARRAAVTPAGPPPITTTSNTVRAPLGPLGPAWRPQPQRGVPRLHRLVYHRDQRPAQPVQIRLLAQFRGETLERLCCVVLPPVEAAVDKAL